MLIASSVSADSLTWTGNTDDQWDITTTNWKDSTETATTYSDPSSDDVTFGDGGSNTAIDLADTWSPLSVTVDNSDTAPYTFSSDSGGSLTGSTGIHKKYTGAGTPGVLTVSTANNFDGTVTIDAGTLVVGNAAALGSTVGGTTVNNGGTLELNGLDIGMEQVTAQGAGVDGLGAIVNTTNASATIRNLVLSGPVTLGGSERINFYESANFNNYKVTVKHSGPGDSSWDAVRFVTMMLPANYPVGLKDIDVVQGGLHFHNALMCNPSDNNDPGTIRILDDGVDYPERLLLYDTATYPNDFHQYKHLVFEGGIFETKQGHYIMHGGVELNNNETVEIYLPYNSSTTSKRPELTIADPITGTGGITKTGTSTYYLWLDAVNTYSGNTTIAEGRMGLHASASISNSPVIDVQAGAIFNVSAVGSFPLGATQTLMGGGKLVGDVVAAAGSSIEPGESAGRLLIDGNLDTSAGADVTWELAALVDDATPGTPGADYDILEVSGNVTLGGGSILTLDFSAVPDPLSGDPFWSSPHTWKVVDAGTNTGSTNFAVLDCGSVPSGWSFNTSVGTGDDEGDIFLNYVVPEPSTFVLLGLAGLFLAAFARRRR
ncbi:MAG: PEP-CTERM sorting domain-containing protein [Pirellulales bacterium]|nr:PEP-CTERM sorting domain-containing protein [Pirellulales bacterium]